MYKYNLLEVLRRFRKVTDDPELCDAAEEEIQKLEEIFKLGKEMRNAQKEFFKKRKKVSDAERTELLHIAQSAEKAYDQAAADSDNEEQPNLL